MEEDKTQSKWIIAIISIIVVLILIFVAIYISGLDNEPEDIYPEDMVKITFEQTDGSSISFHCDVADDSEERQQGLMNVDYLDPKTGMLFIFESPREVAFWMKDTLIPLDIIFINETGYVLNVREAYPEPDTPDYLLVKYQSAGPVIWVVEINQGICAAQDIGPGSYFEIED